MIVIIGGGPAGRTAALHLALAGREVTLVEKGGIGGQCLHYGCMAVCALNDVARSLDSSRKLHHLGILDSAPKVHFPKLLQEMRLVQNKIESILDAETRAAGVDIRYGIEGRLEADAVYIGKESVKADAVIVATGSMPRIPNINGTGLSEVYHPHTLSSMTTLPGRLAIIGGGIMAVEFAYIFHQFGSEVHLIGRSDLLKNLDPKLRATAFKELEGIHIHEHCNINAINGDDRAESVSIGEKVPTEIPCDAVFLAAGLVPRSELLHGVDIGKMGQVIVNRRMQTSRKGVYACGDVTGSPCLTPVARREGVVAAENILGRDAVMDYDAIPQSLNLFSELAFWERDNPNGITFSVPGPAGPGTFWSVPTGTTGLARITVDPDSGNLNAVHTAAPAAGIIAAYTAFLSKCGVQVHDLDAFLEVHPMSDGIYSLLKYASLRLNDPDFSS
ncbi:MAG TPA: NAD(P)/FAD-dependent oxidoreductase [Methanoregulaceae archaeon]|nr:NAD(P)/FAD-dependent oxidoreductase [Methanoregulaceae archaeon]